MNTFVAWLLFLLTFGKVDRRPDCRTIEPIDPVRERGRKVRLPPVPDHYVSNGEHLEHLLRCADLLVRAELLRWRAGSRGADEAHDFLEQPYTSPGELSMDVDQRVRKYGNAARAFFERIRESESRSAVELDLRMRRLAGNLDLPPAGILALMLAMLPSLDERYAKSYALVQGATQLRRASPALLLQLLSPFVEDAEEARAALAGSSPLLRFDLVASTSPEEDEEGLQVDPRITGFLHESDGLEEPLDAVIEGSYAPLDARELFVADELGGRLRALQARLARTGEHFAFSIFGSYGSGRLDTARVLAVRPLLVANVAALADRRAHGWPRLVRFCGREARLAGAALAWRGMEAFDDPEKELGELRELLHEDAERRGSPTFFLGLHAEDPGGRFRQRALLRIGLPMPDASVREKVWKAMLPDAGAFRPGDAAHGREPQADGEEGPVDREALAERMARTFQLTPGQIHDALVSALSTALRTSPDDSRISAADVELGARLQAGRRLNTLATHVAPRAGLELDDIVLPDAQKRQLETLRYRIRKRHEVLDEFAFGTRIRSGRGLLALFTGGSGTGKTTAAEILASQAAMDLYKVDLSRIVSKWVGETEKNLARLFTEATDSNAILFFDEADALFGKRGEVKDARDRWANQEVNFLLQRVEEYSGVVIMASNLQQNMDSAFVRRIQVIVDFPFPNADSRARIWQSLLNPEKTELGEDELRSLAQRFDVSGGSIRNVVVDSAFRAHRRAGKVGSFDLLIGLAHEYRKLGRPLRRSSFRDHFQAVMDELFRDEEPQPETMTVGEDQGGTD